jgi:hypothetical protein
VRKTFTNAMPPVRKLFAQEDDKALAQLVGSLGTENWTLIAQKMSHGFTGRQCRDRWHNYVDPDLNKLSWTETEDQKILQEYARIGPRWVALGAQNGGRTANSVRNRVSLLLRRKAKALGRRELPAIATATADKQDDPSTGEDLWALCDPAELSHFDRDPFGSLGFSGE